ncbi:MAG: hypothetical protein AAFQ65_12035 [Myxococcota bacterium]
MLELFKRGLLLPLLAILLSFGVTACGDDEDTDEPTGQVGDEGSGDGSDDSDDGDDGSDDDDGDDSDDDDSDDDDSDDDGDDADAGVQAIIIDEVEFDDDGDTIEIENRGDTMVDLSDYWLCANRQYDALNVFTIVDEDDNELSETDGDGNLIITIPAGESITVDLGEDILATESDLALYTNIESDADFRVADNMVDYLIWGVPPMPGMDDDLPANRLTEAETAGQWSGDKIDITSVLTDDENPTFQSGAEIEFDGDDDDPNDEASDWDVDVAIDEVVN